MTSPEMVAIPLERAILHVGTICQWRFKDNLERLKAIKKEINYQIKLLEEKKKNEALTK